MRSARALLRTTALVVGLAAAAACDAADRRTARAGAGRAPGAAPVVYSREIAFAGRRDGEPVLVQVVYRTVERDSARTRGVRGWLARGGRWETFVEGSWSGARVGSVWAVVPHRGLRVAAAGATGLESLWFRRGGRNLRLEAGRSLARWNPSASEGYALSEGTILLGTERLSGTLLQLMRARRPGGRSGSSGPANQLLLAGAGGARLLVATGGPAAREASFAWTAHGSDAAEWSEAELIPLEDRVFAPARRRIPIRWRLRIPAAGVEGEVRALGFSAELGGEVGGRREVVVRYSVTGAVRWGDERVPVAGMLRHSGG